MLHRLIREDIFLTFRRSERPAAIMGDLSQCHQLVINLMLNARDALPKGGSIVVSTENVVLNRSLEQNEAQVYVLFRVEDDGHGFDEEVRQRLFDPFFTTKELGKGAGLGLATVHGIVRQHGGFIDVSSSVGKGTVFSIYLPGTNTLPLEKTSKPGKREYNAHGETILFVEDNDRVRKLGLKVLQRHGYVVLEAENPLQALDILEVHPDPIDIVITDVIMPQMSGPEMVRLLAKKAPFVKVLYISGYTNAELSQHGILDPDLHFLPKPLSVEQLIEKVREVLDQ
jgi:two-component system, cell cycle sensor histidine kinase and response regulator CckA